MAHRLSLRVGQTLLEPVMALAAWAEAHRYDIEAARRAYDERAPVTIRPGYASGER